jgi:hypothetical protein
MLAFTPAFSSVICQAVRPLDVSKNLYVVCQGWPCWLATALSLKLPLIGVVFPRALHELFTLGEWGDGSVAWHDLAYFEQLTELPRHCTVLASGSSTFMDEVRHRMPYHQGGFLFCVDTSFDRWTERDLHHCYRAWAQEHTGAGLLSATIQHSDC